MQSRTFIVVLVVCLLVLSMSAFAGEKLGIANSRSIRLSSNTRIGDVLLPPGEYQVKHVMEGENHIMVFTKTGNEKPTGQVKCSLVSLPEKAQHTSRTYSVNSANEQVLKELVFAGDTAKHVF